MQRDRESFEGPGEITSGWTEPGGAGRCPSCESELRAEAICPRCGSVGSAALLLGGRYALANEPTVTPETFFYQALDESTGEPVALRVLRPDAAQSDVFRRAAELLLGVEHRGVLPVRRAELDPNVDLFLAVTDPAVGTRLSDAQSEVGTRSAIRILERLADAIEALEAAGVMVPGLDPRSILLIDGHPVIDVLSLYDGSSVALLDFDALAKSFVSDARRWEEVADEPTVVTFPPVASAGDVVAPKRSPLGTAPPPRGTSESRPLAGLPPKKIDPEGAPTLRTEPLRFRGNVDDDWTDSALAQGTVEAEPRTAGNASALPTAANAGEEIAGDEAEFELIGAEIGGYEIVERIGSGGVGEVYLAEHPVVGSRVAVKVVRADLAHNAMVLDRFLANADALSDVDHPGLVSTLDFGQFPDGRPYVVMEYLQGETLANKLRREGPLPVDLVAEVVVQAARALAVAHARGIVHRDIKPQNLFLVDDDQGVYVKVLDFGLAKSTADAEIYATQHGAYVGTPIYSAPEQIIGAPASPRSDVYSLGVTAFELLAGCPPFFGDEALVIESKSRLRAPPLRSLRPNVSPFVEESIASMLALRASQRPFDMAAVQSLVHGWTASSGRETVQDSPARAGLALPLLARTTLPPQPVQQPVEPAPADAILRLPASSPWSGGPWSHEPIRPTDDDTQHVAWRPTASRRTFLVTVALIATIVSILFWYRFGRGDESSDLPPRPSQPAREGPTGASAERTPGDESPAAPAVPTHEPAAVVAPASAPDDAEPAGGDAHPDLPGDAAERTATDEPQEQRARQSEGDRLSDDGERDGIESDKRARERREREQGEPEKRARERRERDKREREKSERRKARPDEPPGVIILADPFAE